MLHVQSVVLWSFNILFLLLTTVSAAQQQLQVRVGAGLFVWLQSIFTCVQTAH